MVFNATFNNISVISWQSVILVEETGVPGENHRPVVSHWQTFWEQIKSLMKRSEKKLDRLLYIYTCVPLFKSNFIWNIFEAKEENLCFFVTWKEIKAFGFIKKRWEEIG
jgi:hypothetical protein